MSAVSASVYLQTAAGTKFYGRNPHRIEEFLSARRLPSPFVGKANGFLAQRDGTGIGYILLTRADLAQIDQSLSTHKLVFSTGGTTVEIENLHIFTALGVTSTTTQRPTDIFCVELRDRRDHIQFTSVNKGYNIRTPDWVSTSQYFDSSLNAAAAWTWATMVADIWTNISPIAGALTTASTDWPTSNPDNFALFGGNALHHLEHICDSTDHHLICLRDGSFSIVSAGNADATNQALITAYTASNSVLVPSDPQENDAVQIPEKVRVFFTKRSPAFQANADPLVVTGTEQWHTDPTVSYDVTSSAVVPAITGSITGAVHPIYDSMVALYDELGIIQNAAALITQAEKRATEFVQGLQKPNRNDLFHGAIEFQVGALLSKVHWYDFGDGVRTQVFSSPKEEATPSNGNNIATEWPGMPDLSRWHLPYNEFLIGEVYGSNIAPNTSGLVRVQFGTRTSGSVTTWADTGTPHEVTAFEIYGTEYVIGDRVYCGFDRQTSRWIIINASSGCCIVHFELEDSLALGAGDPRHTIASRLELVAGSWVDSGDNIEVYDWYDPKGMWNGDAGFRGLAVIRGEDFTELDEFEEVVEVRPGYDIIWMERIAQKIRFTSTEYMGETNPGEMAATVDYYDHQGIDPGSTTTIYDPNGMFPDAYSGAKGVAYWNNHNQQYEIVECQRLGVHATALLNGANCSGSPTIDNFAIVPFGEYVGSPETAPTSVDNARGHAGIDNDPTFLIRTSNTMPNGTWTVIDIGLHQVLPITTVEISGGNLQYKTKTIYAEQCDTAESSATTIAATTTSCP